MYKDPKLTSKYLDFISSDFFKVAARLKVASLTIRQKGNYAYPVFPTSEATITLGPLLIEQGELGNHLHYYATYLDILLQYKLIAEDKIDAFISEYKDPNAFCCLLVIVPDFTNFVYIPYPAV